MLDRTVGTEIPSQSIVTTVNHGFRSESGVNYFKTVMTDPENNSSTVLTDARGLTVKPKSVIRKPKTPTEYNWGGV